MIRDLVVSLVVLAGTIALYASLSLMEEPAAATFPRVVIFIMGLLSLALLAQSLIIGRRRAAAQAKGTPAPPFPFGTLLLCFGLIVLYLAVMERVGFYLSAFLFFVAATTLLGRKELNLRRWGGFVAIALAFTAVLYVLFNRILVVQTPKGIFF